MKVQIFSVYDKAVQAFIKPFYCRSKGEAVRSFMEACGDEKMDFSKHASDYVMFYLGEFDDISGIFTPVEPQRVISALECLVDRPSAPVNGGSASAGSIDEAIPF